VTRQQGPRRRPAAQDGRSEPQEALDLVDGSEHGSDHCSAPEASSEQQQPCTQVIVLDGFPTTAQVRLLGPNSGHRNRYAVSACRQFVKGWAKLEAGRQGIVPVAPPVRVTLRYVMPDARVRDEDNFAIVGKSAIDGLVKAGILAGDDSKRLTERVVFVISPGARRLEIVIEREQD
jgi:hypothetical protein